MGPNGKPAPASSWSSGFHMRTAFHFSPAIQ